MIEAIGTPARVAIQALPILLGVTLHEVAHGWVASRLGDPTARDAGRLSVNPLRHVDPIGTLLVPALLVLTSGYLFGWARPVPVNPSRLRRPRRDMALVALAGPGANLVMAVVWALVAKLAVDYHAALGASAMPLLFMGVAGVFVNTVLGVLNMLPLPPLDGGRVLASLLPPRAARALGRVERWGFPILLVLLLSGALGRVLGPAVAYVGIGVASLFNLSPDLFVTVLIALQGRG